MAWRLARSLETLRSEVWSLHPGTTFWTIGDQDHASGPSDHNPNADGVVCAADVLGDKGLRLGMFAEAVRTSGHRAFKYVIFNRRIAHRGGSWQPYYGDNPHETHVHVSVGIGDDGQSTGPYDDTSPWGIGENMELTDQVKLGDWAVKQFPDLADTGKRSVGTLLGSGYGHAREAKQLIKKEVLAGQTAILAAIKGDDAPAIGKIVAAELAKAAEAERVERAAEREELVGPLAAAVADAVDHELDTKAVEEALRRVLGSVDQA